MTSLVAGSAQLAPPPATSSRPFLTRRSEGESGRTWRWGWRKSGNPGCLGYIGDNTTQLYRDYNKRFWGSLLTNQYFMESSKGFFSWLRWGWRKSCTCWVGSLDYIINPYLVCQEGGKGLGGSHPNQSHDITLMYPSFPVCLQGY